MNRTSGADSAATPERAAPELRALLERVEAATGPGRELEIDLCAALFGGSAEGIEEAKRSHRFRSTPLGGLQEPFHSELRNYTASVDAALALVERKLAGWEWEASFLVGLYRFELGDPLLGFVGESAAAPLAILAALLKALIASDPPPSPAPQSAPDAPGRVRDE